MARPLSARAHAQVLDAASKLFADHGIDRTSMDAIAAASGVSKATIYNHWPDKDALCLEVMAHAHGYDTESDDVDSGDLRADMLAVLTRRPPEKHQDLRSRLMPHLMAHAARNPVFGKAWRDRVLEPPRARLARVLRRAISRGLLLDTLDVDLATALLFGPMMYSKILKLPDSTKSGSLAEFAVDFFLKSQGVDPRSRLPRSHANH